ncbi:MAG: SDR family oxidoreductase [Planctomycetota bacterium]|nr:SDR family oxidoreductase [Planctomycetota bacterium]
MDLGLKDRAVFIGGASAGLGKACAAAFAREGCSLMLVARREDELRKLAEELKTSTKARIGFIAADLSTAKGVEKAVASTLDAYGRIDVVFTNTGGPPPGTFFDHEEATWVAAFEQLLMSVVRICRLVIPHMKRQQWGRIINDTSIAVKEPLDNLILSNVFRTAVVSLAKSISREVARYNILVNNICPGFHATTRMEEVIRSRAKRTGASYDDALAAVLKDVPLGRLLQPDELASLVVFLASEKASGITGTSILVDGGLARGLM